MKKSIFIMPFVLACLLTACTTPAMAPSHIALLHSGSMVVAVPDNPYATLASPRVMRTGDAMAMGAGMVLGGMIGGAIAGGLIAGHVQAIKDTNAVLRPYADRIRALYPRQEFLAMAHAAAGHVHWMGTHPAVRLYGKSGVPGSGKMSHLVQSSGTQAIVLVKCEVGFSVDMKALATAAQVEVYARGTRRGNLIDGGSFEESTQLTSTGPALKSYGYEGIAAGKLDDRAALGARANVWLENSGERFKVAIAEDMARLQIDLTNYLNGKRTSS